MAKISRVDLAVPALKKRKQAAAYARVSVESEKMNHSLSAQVSYYSSLIQKNPEWEYAGVYADDFVSGTGTAKRDEFNRILVDCEAGKIDIILVKSISRFARSTVDLLETVRHLKDIGVEVRFEREHISSFSGDGELMLTILASFAQEESRSISENVTWGQRKRFADGKVSFAYSRVLGLDKGPDGTIVVNTEQAETVLLIFSLFLEGMSPHSIAAELTRRGIKTPGGKDVWNQQTVRRMLSNENYKGDALLQKEFTVDFLTKKMKKNEGQVPQYYVEGNHEAIISPAVFDMVHAELEKRRGGGSCYSGVSIFSNKIKCMDCGGWFGSKVWHSTDQYRKVIYRCNRKYSGEKCQTPHVTEDEVKAAFVSTYNQLVIEKKEIIANAEVIRRTLCRTDDLEAEKRVLEEEMPIAAERAQGMIAENARIAQNQDDYQERYESLVERYNAAKTRYDEVVDAIAAKVVQSERLSGFIGTMQAQQGILTEFDKRLWSSMVDYVTVGRGRNSSLPSVMGRR